MEAQRSYQLDYKKVTYLHPSYRKLKLLQQSGGGSVTLSTAGGNESLIEIPVKAFNLARSHINFQLTPTASAATFYNYAFADAFTPFRQLQLYTRSGIYLCDLNEVTNYTKTVWKPETKLQDFLSYDFFDAIDLHADSCGRYLCRNNALGTATTRTVVAPMAIRYDGSAATLNYTEPKYLIVPAGSAAATPVLNVSIPLNAFKNTIFELDKDLFMNEILVLRIVWQSTTKMYFNATSVTDPTAGVQAMAVGCAVSNLALYLAVEKDQEVTNSLMAKVATEGMQILIPYVYTYKYNTGNNTNYSVSYRFNRGHGRKLKKIYHSAFNATETSSTAISNANTTTIGVNQFYTLLDNERIQDYNLNTSTFDDYQLLQPKLKGSVIQSADIYYYNWFWLDEWTGLIEKGTEPSNEQNLETGLDLSQERKYDFYAVQVNNNAAATYNTYTFAVTEKLLTVSAAGISCI
jgi:hypothetical protein